MKCFNRPFIIAFIVVVCISSALAQLPPVFTEAYKNKIGNDDRVRKYITAQRIVWASDSSGKYLKGAQNLLNKSSGQAELNGNNLCVLKSDPNTLPGLLLDFGKEIQGGLQIITSMNPSKTPVRIRVRFGESVSEAMSDIDNIKGATNDHAVRDFIAEVPWLGALEIGNSGFRFARIDLVDANIELRLKEISAIFSYRDLSYKGSFHCSDEKLNRIWLTGAYTVQLNMQEYLWDGIKRDRLVWVGDMHPEVATINAVFGSNEVVEKSLDLSRDNTILPQWMNDISSYSMWWILIQHDLYMHNGNMIYLKEQKIYLLQLLQLLMTKIDKNNSEQLDGNRFLDWPSSDNVQAVHAGLQAMMVLALNAGAELCSFLKEESLATKCKEAANRLKKNVPPTNNSKQAASLLSLADMLPADSANKIISKNGAAGFSTFFGYYMLQAKARAGDYQGALENIRTYWGAMLNLGATTFWEDFNLDWLTDAARIDELVPTGKKDIHGDYGAYCYKGFRHSLCHGWASGPTPWLTENVLGITIVEAGCKKIKITPHLGDLEFAEGDFPTPYGVMHVRHVKLVNGKIKTTVSSPKQVTIIQ